MKIQGFFAVLSILFFSAFVLADAGPKPTTQFDLVYAGQWSEGENLIPVVLECYDQKGGYGDYGYKIINPKIRNRVANISKYDAENRCYWSPSIYFEVTASNATKNMGCKINPCSIKGIYYSGSSGLKLAVYILHSDEVFISKTIKPENFHSMYEVELTKDGYFIFTEKTPLIKIDNISNFLKALIFTLIIELSLVGVFVSHYNIVVQKKRLLSSLLLGNITTISILWFILPIYLKIPLVIISGEVFAIIFETWIVYKFNQKTFPLKKALTFSIILNLASFTLGEIIYILIFIGIIPYPGFI